MNNPFSTPTKSTSRIGELDIFRGFAIWGIFMVNILVMNVSFVYRGEWEAEQTGSLQKMSLFVLEHFFYNKFFAIFSLLFGMGVALQIQGSKEKLSYKTSFFIRRFGSLFLLGVLHIVFLWSGDILHLYGLLGLLLLVFFKLSARWLLVAAILVFLFPYFHDGFDYLIGLTNIDLEAPLAELSRLDILALKHNGNYLSGINLRLKEYAFASPFIFSGIAPVAFSMMLFGGYLVKKGVLTNIPYWVDKVKVYLIASLVVLLVCRYTILYWVLPTYKIPPGSNLSIALITIYQLSDVVLSLVYLWLIAFLFERPFFQRILSPLRYVGRAALSNYILQSLLGYWIMRTFNLYESFSPFSCIVLVICVFSIQILLSKIWFTSFLYGPLEWCWRCISYMKILPIKIKEQTK